MRMTRRLAKKMLKVEDECAAKRLPMRHACGRRDQARLLLRRYQRGES